MSNEALTAVSKSDIRPSGRKFVLMALADYADENWSCFPSVDQLAKYTGQGEKTVRDHLLSLETDGMLSRDRQRREDGTLGRYRFKIHRRNLPVANFARGEKQPEPPANFAAHNPQENHHISTSLRSVDKRTPRQELETVLDAEHASDVIEHRNRIKSPMTAKAAKMLAGKLSRFPDPNAAADLMIEKGWRSIEPEWVDNAKARASPQSRKPDRMSLGDAMRELMSQQDGRNGPFEADDRATLDGDFRRIPPPVE